MTKAAPFIPLPRPAVGYLMMCAWNNVDPEAAPDQFRRAPSATDLEAWARVADAAIEWYRMATEQRAAP